MIPGVAIGIAENLTIEAIHRDKESTTLAIVSTGEGLLPYHRHLRTNETIKVEKGWVLHVETGRRYTEGESWEIPIGEWHSAIFSPNCFVLVICKPTLPTAKESPVDIDDMEKAFLHAKP